MNVYLVISGESFEGGEVEGVFSTKEAADKYAEELTKKIGYRDWIKTPTGWTGGCDSIDVEAHEVKGEPVKTVSEELIRDSARYNFLRNNNTPRYGIFDDEFDEFIFNEDADEIIDEAMLKARAE